MGGIAVALSACGIGATQPKIGADGRPLPRVYKINGATADKIPFRVLDSINTLRAANNHYNETITGLVGKQGLHGQIEKGRFFDHVREPA